MLIFMRGGEYFSWRLLNSYILGGVQRGFVTRNPLWLAEMGGGCLNFLTYRQNPSILNRVLTILASVSTTVPFANKLPKLTDLDYKIIRRLNEDARLSSAALARELQTSERTVRHRIERLIREDVLKPVAVVNPQAFGYNLVVDIFCEVEISARDEVVESIRRMPEVSYMAFSTGEQDISFQALFKNSKDMHEFITQRLYSISGVRRTKTVLVPQIVKDTYQWLPPEDEFAL